MAPQKQTFLSYRAESADSRIVQALDEMTLIYQRRSGITHIVAEPVPQILEAMGDTPCDAEALYASLSKQFDLGDAAAAKEIIAARLEELAELGLVDRVGGVRARAAQGNA
jgi:PqqD family protein of HPr-rel-A system